MIGHAVAVARAVVVVKIVDVTYLVEDKVRVSVCVTVLVVVMKTVVAAGMVDVFVMRVTETLVNVRTFVTFVVVAV